MTPFLNLDASSYEAIIAATIGLSGLLTIYAVGRASVADDLSKVVKEKNKQIEELNALRRGDSKQMDSLKDEFGRAMKASVTGMLTMAARAASEIKKVKQGADQVERDTERMIKNAVAEDRARRTRQTDAPTLQDSILPTMGVRAFECTKDGLKPVSLDEAFSVSNRGGAVGFAGHPAQGILDALTALHSRAERRSAKVADTAPVGTPAAEPPSWEITKKNAAEALATATDDPYKALAAIADEPTLVRETPRHVAKSAFLSARYSRRPIDDFPSSPRAG